MIKVIKPRTRKNVECANCGALLSYEEEDVKRSATKTFSGTAYDPFNTYKNYIICPECGEEITLNG